MFCKHCGAKIDPDVLFCSKCGHQVQKEAAETSPESRSELKKSGVPFWFKIIVTLIILGLLIGALVLIFNEDLVNTVSKQLQTLKNNKITEAYYDFTAKAFQEATSLNTFRDFIKSYPEFTENSSVNFIERSIENGVGTVEAMLTDRNGKSIIAEYKLLKEGNKWKIISVKLLQSSDLQDTFVDSSPKEELKAPIKAQLEAFHSRDISKAYYGLVSKQFEKETPFNKFALFVKNYPMLTNFQNVTFDKFSSNADRGNVTVILDVDGKKIPVEYTLALEGNSWKIWSLRIVLPETNVLSSKQSEVAPLITIVKKQLASLKNGDFDDAYKTYTSDEFKKATSLDAFKTFLQRHPILSQYSDIELSDPIVGNGTAKIKVFFKGDQPSGVEYSLGMEGGNWKIWGMQIIPHEQAATHASSPQKPEENFSTEEFRNVIMQQLEQIRKKNILEAYHNYTSEGFQKATSLKEFETFINEQPAYNANSSANLVKLNFNNNIGTYEGTLTSKDGRVYAVEYDLIYQDGKWKILHIQISPPIEEPKAKDTSVFSRIDKKDFAFEKIILGSTVDQKGIITQPSMTFTNPMGDIYANVQVRNGQVKDTVELHFLHLDSHSAIDPISTHLPNDGNSTVSFVFSPPPKGWPKGNYRVDATSSTGVKKSAEFTVE